MWPTISPNVDCSRRRVDMSKNRITFKRREDLVRRLTREGKGKLNPRPGALNDSLNGTYEGNPSSITAILLQGQKSGPLLDDHPLGDSESDTAPSEGL